MKILHTLGLLSALVCVMLAAWWHEWFAMMGWLVVVCNNIQNIISGDENE